MSALLGVACLAGTANAAAAAPPAPHTAAQATAATAVPADVHRAPARPAGGDYGDDECDGLIVLLCL
ncbi:hypothetical protein [Streptomyces sp. NPDC007205]|uniref:hypothetical protein n=1 Tax=Streptomyces sp. NPDC007205 TaxID=3154316 RepID=UPI0033E26ABC